MRLRPTMLPLAERILEHLSEHGPIQVHQSRERHTKRGTETLTAHSSLSKRLGRPAAARPGSWTRRDDPPLTRCGIWVAKRCCRWSRTPDDPGRPHPDRGGRMGRSSPLYEGDDPDDPPRRANPDTLERSRNRRANPALVRQSETPKPPRARATTLCERLNSSRSTSWRRRRSRDHRGRVAPSRQARPRARDLAEGAGDRYRFHPENWRAIPSSPWLLNDAAIILRAERLLIEGIKVDTAVATARAELIAWVEPEETASAGTCPKIPPSAFAPEGPCRRLESRTRA